MRLCVFILMLASLACAQGLVRLSGDVPPELSERRLNAHYNRICRQVAPRHGCGRRPIRVLFYRRSSHPHTALRIPEWGGGGAIGPDSIIVPLDKPFVVRRNIEQIVVHELVHCALLRAARDAHIPRWYHEGVAMLLSGEVQLEEKLALSRAALVNRLIAFDRIEEVNRWSRQQALLAYSQSHAAVQFLVERYGIETLGLLVDAAATDGSFEYGLHAVLGLTPPELHRLLKEGIRRRYGLAYVLGDMMYVWFIIVALAVLAFIVVRRRNTLRSAQMERDERTPAPGPDTTDADDTVDTDSPSAQ